MTSRDFAYWLQGFFEVGLHHAQKPQTISSEQLDIIKNHLAMVFKHEIDPSMGSITHQDVLAKIHATGYDPTFSPKINC